MKVIFFACPVADASRRLALLNALLWQLAAAAAASTPSSGPAPAIRAWITARAAQPGLGRSAVARAFGRAGLNRALIARDAARPEAAA